MQKIILCLLLSSNTLLADDADQLKRDIDAYSEYIGYSAAQSMKAGKEWIDLEVVIRGIKKFCANDQPPIKTTEDGNSDELLNLEQRLHEHQARENLKKSEAFLQTLRHKENIHSLDDGKILYETLQRGNGSSKISEKDIVTVRYSLTDLNGDKIGFSQMREPCTFDLQDILPGLVQAMAGMVKGETRKIYLHPDKAYGKQDDAPPNSFVIAEVELLEIVD